MPLLLLPLIACQGEKSDDLSLDANALKDYPIIVNSTLDGFNNLSSCVGPIQILRNGVNLPKEVAILINSNAKEQYEDSNCTIPLEFIDGRVDYSRVVLKQEEAYKKEIYVSVAPFESPGHVADNAPLETLYYVSQDLVINAYEEADMNIESNPFQATANEGILPGRVLKVTPVGFKNLRVLMEHSRPVKSMHWILDAKVTTPGYSPDNFFHVAYGDVEGNSAQYNLSLGDFSFASTIERRLILTSYVEVEGKTYVVENPTFEF